MTLKDQPAPAVPMIDAATQRIAPQWQEYLKRIESEIRSLTGSGSTQGGQIGFLASDEITVNVPYPEDGQIIYLALSSQISRTFTKAVYKTSAGTCTVTPSFTSALSVTSTQGETAFSVAQAVGDSPTLTISSVSADCENLVITLHYTQATS